MFGSPREVSSPTPLEPYPSLVGLPVKDNGQEFRGQNEARPWNRAHFSRFTRQLFTKSPTVPLTVAAARNILIPASILIEAQEVSI